MKLYFLLIICLAEQAFGVVPPYIHVCARDDPELEKCIIESVDNLRDKLRSGIPELDVPALEPLVIKEITLADDPSFKAIAKGVKFYGFPDFEVKSVKTNFEKQRFDINVAFKKIRLQAEYDVATRVVVPIVGKGPINIVAEDVTAKVILKYQLVNRKGGQYLYFPTMTTKLTIRDYTSHFVAQEGSDGTLAEGINAVLTQDKQAIIDTMTPNIEKAVSSNIIQIGNKICQHFKFDELFRKRT